MDPPPEPSAPRRPLTALAATTAIQVWATVALTAPAVLAPVVAPLLDVPPERIGVFVGIAYLAAMFSGLVGSGFVPRHGGVAVSQFALLACATGLAIAPVGGLWMLPLAAVAIGIGYGLTNPSSAKILGEHAPPHRRGLLFSIKQSGVPIGVSITALLIPALLALTGWRVSVALLASVAVALALALLPARRRLESAARAPSPAPPAAADSLQARVVAPLATVLRDPALRRLGIASYCYALSQVCFLTFVVSYLNLELGYPLAAAAGVLAAAQVVSVAGRIALGHVADRWIDPAVLLGVLGVAMSAAIAGLGLVTPASPAWQVTAVALACAGTCVAWNGVFFAELARRAPIRSLATVTGGTQFLTFFGGMSGPLAFGASVTGFGSYGVSYLTFATLPLAVGLWLLVAAHRARSR